MGIGDELMAAGEAQRQAAGRPRRYRMLNKRGEAKWHFVWEGHPNIARLDEPHDGAIGYVNGTRPYIASLTPTRYTFQAYRPVPAIIRLQERHRELARLAQGAVVFNPTTKDRAAPGKQWGIDRWKRLVALTPGVRWIQIGDARSPRIRGAQLIQTADFFEACGVLSGARLAVVHEGALHHAAAGLNVRTIVIRGGFISPKVTGYLGQVDFYVDDPAWPLGCGSRIACAHCDAAMAAIKPEAVAATVLAMLKG